MPSRHECPKHPFKINKMFYDLFERQKKNRAIELSFPLRIYNSRVNRKFIFFWCKPLQPQSFVINHVKGKVRDNLLFFGGNQLNRSRRNGSALGTIYTGQENTNSCKHGSRKSSSRTKNSCSLPKKIFLESQWMTKPSM